VADVTRMESSISFLQMGSAMSLQEKIRQVHHEICQNRRQTASVRLEAITGADNPSSLIQVFRRGHIIAKSGAVAFVTRCNPVEVVPRAASSNGNDIEAKRNEASILRHFFYRSETNKLILKL
jgi:hypothetical protein